ncbi:YbbR domain-containing protein [Caldalkalibacillus uzonensis]|uniref:YbbR domain-containing protein n=1 Tax=Caldalkalibacillus uzonensis TaxID=353224 RepID=A0ABU0CVD4_9BACI|nr:CdaR family protein [Caldalkalibacillus uzonensis]MDQ0340289.1 YbbR domain-containing protein [Caldalkalibacillus uzonensis]
MDKFFENNTAMKGIAFLIALMLWMIVTLDQEGSTTIRQTEEQLTIDNVRVEAVYDEEQYALMEMDETVQVILTGRRALLNLVNLRQDVYRLYVDLTELGEGEHRVPVQHEGFPRELSVTVIPSHVYVVLEKKESRVYPVQIDLSGQLPEGYEVGEPLVTPREVEVLAPTSVLEEIASVRGLINLERLGREGKQTVTLKAYDRKGQEIEAQISPDTVEVTVPIQSPSAKVPLNIELINELPEGLSLVDIRPNTEAVEVFAPQSVLDQLEDIRVTLDLSTIEQSKAVTLDVEWGDHWTAVKPQQVVVHVEVELVQERLFRNVPLEVRGLASGYELIFQDPADGKLQLAVLGSEQRLKAMQHTELKAWIDAKGLKEGEHRLPVNINLPEHLSVSPSSVEVEVQIRPLEKTESTMADAEEDEQQDNEDNEEGE